MRTVTTGVATAARAIAKLVDANPELPMPSWHLYRNGGRVDAQLATGHGDDVDAWAALFDATPTVFPYTRPEDAGLGSRSFRTVFDGVDFRFWTQVEVRQVVPA